MEYVDFGICRLSVIPVRAKSADSSEMISQLLFGEHYRVLEITKDGKWYRIQNGFDDYEGWIDQNQHYPITKEYHKQLESTEYKICTDLTARILFRKNVTHVTIGAILPLLSNPLFEMEEQLAFNGEAKSLHQRWGVEQLVTLSKKYLNTPYLWGGKTPFGIDCSGFTQMVFKIGGYQLKRDSGQQILQGKEVSLKNAMPGDLAFFTNKKGVMNHVGIVLKDSQIIHASGRVRIDELDEKGIFSKDNNRYTHTLFKLKRIIRKT